MSWIIYLSDIYSINKGNLLVILFFFGFLRSLMEKNRNEFLFHDNNDIVFLTEMFRLSVFLKTQTDIGTSIFKSIAE